MARYTKLMHRNNVIIFISLFAIFGGVQVYRSYAASNPAVTLNTGSYNLADFADETQVGVYQIALSKNLNYCVKQTQAPQTDFILIHDDTAYESVQMNTDSTGKSCFSPTIQWSKALVALPKGMQTTNTLAVITK